jgi:putative PIN family toxin of toxin-antitoxin system
VLDTNVLLDWLVFGDPRVAPLAGAVLDGSLRWVASADMLDELHHVLSRPPLGLRRPPSLDSILARCCQRVPAAPASLPLLRCTDPDDQKFIDLALHRGCAWLITRDRALLKLRRRAAQRGVQVIPPAQDRSTPE